MPVEKQCTECGLTLPLSSFHKSSAQKDGHKSRCKDCRCRYSRQYQRDNKDAICDRLRREYAQNAELRATVIERAMDWSRKHPERRREIAAEHYQKHKDQYKARSKVWKRSNRARLREGKRRRQAIRNTRAAGNGGYVSPKKWLGILSAAGGTCQYCGATKDKLTMDHFVSISMGGGSVESNLIPCCGRCNSRKSNHVPAEWITTHFGEERLANVLQFLAENESR